MITNRIHFKQLLNCTLLAKNKGKDHHTGPVRVRLITKHAYAAIFWRNYASHYEQYGNDIQFSLTLMQNRFVLVTGGTTATWLWMQM